MNRNGLYGLIGVLVIAVVALVGYLLYEQSQKPHVDISVDKGGIHVNGNG